MRALILFAKAPEPGSVKTRLTASITPDQAATLYEAFLLDTLSLTQGLRGVQRVMACDPSRSLPFFKALSIVHRLKLINQQGRTLGLRMRNAAHTVWKPGMRGVILLGTDSPTLPKAHLEEAAAMLGHVDVVIGPSTDGGYCLIGLSKPGLPIFDRISWGTDRVLSETLNRIAKAKLSCHLLPFWYDVDTPAHLDLLRSHLPLLHKKGRLEAVHTYRALKNLG